MSGLKHRDNESPLEFIQNNLGNVQPPQAVDPQQVLEENRPSIPEGQSASTEQPVGPQPEASESASSGDIDFAPPVEAPKATGGDQADPTAGQDASSDDVDDLPDEATAENFKRLRKLTREHKERLKEKENAVAELSEKVKAYESGTVVPEVVHELESRVQELSKYEQLHNLKMSPAYRAKYIEPLDTMQNKLASIGEDYGVPKEVMEHASQISNRAELNRFLSQHFDEIGALEAKQVINNMQSLKEEAAVAEQSPAARLAELEDEHKQIRQVQDHRRKSAIASRAKDSWGDALMSIKAEGKATELIFKDNDTAHNENFVLPILKAASQEYGKIVNSLAEDGLQVLNPKLAYAIARSVLYGHASAVSIESREAALRHAQEVSEATKRKQTYNRPTVGGFGGAKGGTAPAPSSVKRAGETADTLLSQVMGGK